MVLKGYVSLAVTALLAAFLVSCDSEETPKTAQFRQPHIGVWEDSVSGQEKAVMALREDGTGSLRLNRQDYNFQYVIDYARKPIALDLVYSREGEPFRARAIVRFIEGDQMKLRTFFDEKRPEAFSPEDTKNTVLLKRVDIKV